MGTFATDNNLPSFPAFCSRFSPKKPRSRIGYLPLIPQCPTDPSVVKEEMIRLVNLTYALGHEYTIIAGDPATFELAYVVREKSKQLFDKVVLLLGGFHLAHNCLKAVCKIV